MGRKREACNGRAGVPPATIPCRAVRGLRYTQQMRIGAMNYQGHWCVAVLLLSGACKKPVTDSPPSGASTQPTSAQPSAAAQAAQPAGFPLAALRAKLKTNVFMPAAPREAAPEPPAKLFQKVTYTAPLGKNVAYVSPPQAGAKRPAIVWISGGFNWSIGADSWELEHPSNDQSARAFRDAGVVLMRPALRGGNDNPGKGECFLGEVDDVLAAADYLAARADVDPQRIYLGGHSTGGTMALLAAASSDRFRAVFAFGPVADARQYGDSGCLPANVSETEAAPRAAIDFVKDIRTPTFVIEGEKGNVDVLAFLKSEKKSAPLELVTIPGADHISSLFPASVALARQILADTGPAPSFKLDAEAIGKQAAENAAKAP